MLNLPNLRQSTIEEVGVGGDDFWNNVETSFKSDKSRDFLGSCFVLVPCVRYGYNSLKKILLLCYCVARDTHFSAFI